MKTTAPEPEFDNTAKGIEEENRNTVHEFVIDRIIDHAIPQGSY